MESHVDWNLIITTLGLIGSLFIFVITLAVKVGKSMQAYTDLKKDFEEERNRNRSKFADYYKFKSETQNSLTRIQSDTSNILEAIKELKEELKEERKK